MFKSVVRTSAFMLSVTLLSLASMTLMPVARKGYRSKAKKAYSGKRNGNSNTRECHTQECKRECHTRECEEEGYQGIQIAAADSDSAARARNRNRNRNRNDAEAHFDESPITATVTSPQTVFQNQTAIQKCFCNNTAINNAGDVTEAAGAAGTPALTMAVNSPAEVYAYAFTTEASTIEANSPVVFSANSVTASGVAAEGDALVIQSSGRYRVDFTVAVSGSALFELTNNGASMPGVVSGVTGFGVVELKAGDKIQLLNKSGAPVTLGSKGDTTASLSIFKV